MTTPGNHWKPCVEHLTKRLDALEELVMKQHEIIGKLINAGKKMEKEKMFTVLSMLMMKEMKKNEEED